MVNWQAYWTIFSILYSVQKGMACITLRKQIASQKTQPHEDGCRVEQFNCLCFMAWLIGNLRVEEQDVSYIE